MYVYRNIQFQQMWLLYPPAADEPFSYDNVHSVVIAFRGK